MPLRTLPRRAIRAYAHRTAFAPWCLRIAAKLGYEIHLVDEGNGDGACELVPPDLWIADERRLADVPDDARSRAIPVIVLCGRGGVTGADSRIAAAVRRPAGIHDLFRVFQELLEETPRAALRVPTHLPARCRRNGAEWSAAVLSISENGCLLRSPESVPLGGHLEIEFPLPRVGMIATEAEAAYQLVPDMGLVFRAIAPATRQAIHDYVLEGLAGV